MMKVSKGGRFFALCLAVVMALSAVAFVPVNAAQADELRPTFLPPRITMHQSGEWVTVELDLGSQDASYVRDYVRFLPIVNGVAFGVADGVGFAYGQPIPLVDLARTMQLLPGVYNLQFYAVDVRGNWDFTWISSDPSNTVTWTVEATGGVDTTLATPIISLYSNGERLQINYQLPSGVPGVTDYMINFALVLNGTRLVSQDVDIDFHGDIWNTPNRSLTEVARIMNISSGVYNLQVFAWGSYNTPLEGWRSALSNSVAWVVGQALPATQVTRTGAVLSWNAVPGAVAYEVHFRTTYLSGSYLVQSGTTVNLHNVIGNVVVDGVVDGDVNARTFDYVYIRAVGGVDGWAAGLPSNRLEGFIMPTRAGYAQLNAPSLVINGTVLSWDTISGAGSYQVDFISDDYGFDVAASVNVGNVTSVNLNNLENFPAGYRDDFRHIRIRAIATNRATIDSASNLVAELRGLPAPQIARGGVGIVSDSVISWSAVEGAASYTLSFSGLGALGSIPNITSTSFDLHEIEVLNEAYRYTFEFVEVFAVSADGTHSPASNRIENFTISSLPEDEATPSPAPNLNTASVWARAYIQSAFGKGFIPLEIQNNYQNVITRLEFARMAVMFIEYAANQNIDVFLAARGLTRDQGAFTDTNDSYILAAFALGITTGTGANQFTPGGQLTREQAATMLQRVWYVLGLDVAASSAINFVDYDDFSSWAVAGINFVSSQGVMEGVGGNRFNPQGTFTIEQSIITFDRIQ